jgi:hypothetical protein
MTLTKLQELTRDYIDKSWDWITEIELDSKEFTELKEEIYGTGYITYVEHGGVTARWSHSESNKINKVEDISNNSTTVNIPINACYLSFSNNSSGNNVRAKHECSCDSYDLLWRGCKCGGK